MPPRPPCLTGVSGCGGPGLLAPTGRATPSHGEGLGSNPRQSTAPDGASGCSVMGSEPDLGSGRQSSILCVPSHGSLAQRKSAWLKPGRSLFGSGGSHVAVLV